MLVFRVEGQGFRIDAPTGPILRQAPDGPAFWLGRGRARMDMVRGNFAIEDRIESRIPLVDARIDEGLDGTRIALAAYPGGPSLLVLALRPRSPSRLDLDLVEAAPGFDRFWLRLVATPGEALHGGGEQMSHLDLAGRRYPIWTSEPGVGRDPSTLVTWRSEVTGKAGGDYWHTNAPQPTLISSQRWAVHLATTAYAELDLRDPAHHELHAWAVPTSIGLHAEPEWPSLVGALSERFGRQPRLPDWVGQGVILGLKRGEDHARAMLDRARSFGMPLAGLWCEDWAGIRQTSFGTRLFWDWQWQPARYPRLPELIRELHDEGMRFLAYASCYLASDGALFREADALGHFARDASGATALVDFGEFTCGVPDFTRPQAADWFGERILGRNMLDIGIDGWMADFGEYLPLGLTLANGAPCEIEHNAWPVRWAEVNAKAVASRGRAGDAVFFMRAGFAGSQAHCALLWAGDQSVDFSRHDGIVTTIPAALQAGLQGHAYSHSDIGGYTSLFTNRRTPELFCRWAELAAFTACMRTHEGNRPLENFQWWEDDRTARHLASMGRVFTALAPYRRVLIEEAHATGLPLQRPLFLHHPGQPALHRIIDQFLLGPDLLVAPVVHAGQASRQVALPTGEDWIEAWSGRSHQGGTTPVLEAPLGRPAILVRAATPRAGMLRDALREAVTVP